MRTEKEIQEKLSEIKNRQNYLRTKHNKHTRFNDQIMIECYAFCIETLEFVLAERNDIRERI